MSARPTTISLAALALLVSACAPSDRSEPTDGAAPARAGNDRRIDYVEFRTNDVPGTKAFYSELFGWEFTDYGPDYTSFHDGRLAGGFAAADAITVGGPLVVIYVADLDDLLSRIEEHGGRIVREPFEFPGGRRFHFTDPSGNELAAWSER